MSEEIDIKIRFTNSEIIEIERAENTLVKKINKNKGLLISQWNKEGGIWVNPENVNYIKYKKTKGEIQHKAGEKTK